MPAQNRVSPRSELIAVEARGTLMGNRGCLHRGDQIVRPWDGQRWIVCDPSYRGRRVPQWAPGRYTVLFFLDEAVALAAGHRPCFECRRDAAKAFCAAWEVGFDVWPSADDLDERLHRDRLVGDEQRTHERPWSEVPDAAFVDIDGVPHRVDDDAVRPWRTNAYGPAVARPTTGSATVLTPAATVEVLRHGYHPLL